MYKRLSTRADSGHRETATAPQATKANSNTPAFFLGESGGILEGASRLGENYVGETETKNCFDLRAQRFSFGLLHVAIDEPQVPATDVHAPGIPRGIDRRAKKFAPFRIQPSASAFYIPVSEQDRL